MSLSSEQRTTAETDAMKELADFPLVEALYGRRSRRFALGAEIPDGPLAYRSQHEPLPPCTGATRKLGRRAGEGPQLRLEGGDDPLGIGNQRHPSSRRG